MNRHASACRTGLFIAWWLLAQALGWQHRLAHAEGLHGHARFALEAPASGGPAAHEVQDAHEAHEAHEAHDGHQAHAAGDAVCKLVDAGLAGECAPCGVPAPVHAACAGNWAVVPTSAPPWVRGAAPGGARGPP